MEGGTVRHDGLLAERREFRAEFVDDGLGLKIPDLDARLSRGAQPVAVRGEAQGVDDVTRIEGVQTLAFTQIPEHGNAILTTRRTQRTIRRDGDGVDVASVADQVGADLAVREVPDLHELIPATRHDDRVGGHRGEANARDPFGVRVGILDGVLALTQSIPQLDSLIAGAGNNLAVVDGERDGQHILGMANESASGGTRVQVPKAESTVPRTRKRELAVGRDHDVLHEVGVAVERTARVTIVLFFTGQVPKDDGLIAGRRQKDVRVVQRGGDGRNPVFVTACVRRARDVRSEHARYDIESREKAHIEKFNRLRLVVSSTTRRIARFKRELRITPEGSFRPYGGLPRARESAAASTTMYVPLEHTSELKLLRHFYVRVVFDAIDVR